MIIFRSSRFWKRKASFPTAAINHRLLPSLLEAYYTAFWKVKKATFFIFTSVWSPSIQAAVAICAPQRHTTLIEHFAAVILLLAVSALCKDLKLTFSQWM